MVIIVTTGMAAFLDCLQQFKEEVEKEDSDFNLPYGMEKGKIKDLNTGSRQRYFIFHNKFFFLGPFKSDQCLYIYLKYLILTYQVSHYSLQGTHFL